MSGLVRWLPQIVEATADDIAQFGPQAARVRALLEFLPTMSRNARVVSEEALDASMNADRLLHQQNKSGLFDYATENVGDIRRDRPEFDKFLDNAQGQLSIGPTAPRVAINTEVLSGMLNPEYYQVLTNPLAAGRAVDLLRNRPRYQGTPFLDVVRQAAERGLIAGPRDVAAVGRVAQVPDKVAQQEALDLILNYGMSPEEAIIAIRALR